VAVVLPEKPAVRRLGSTGESSPCSDPPSAPPTTPSHAAPVAFIPTTFPNDGGYDGLILVRDIEFSSLCEHHLRPFAGGLWRIALRETAKDSAEPTRVIEPRGPGG
jgi:hypothetical protein